MGVKKRHIAIICNYELLESRVGGMDYFFWAFNSRCKEEDIDVDWFFPNTATHGDYKSFHIILANNKNMEQSFISHITTQNVSYAFIITHFMELCTSFFADIKKHQKE